MRPERPDLRCCLARHHMRRKRFGQSKKFRNKTPIPRRISIKERPAAVARRKEIGHWEGDLMVARSGRAAVHVLVERVTRRVCLSKISDRTAPTVRRKIISRLKAFPEHCRKTITYDNGKENVEHQVVNDSLGTKSYFADSYAAWQKGSVENSIGIVRRKYPKGTDLSTLSLQALKRLERQLNNTPRMCLQFQTPMEVFRTRSVALHC
jgi:transposase, IS30 family